MEKACTAQVKHSLSKHWQFATNFAGRESKPLFPFAEGDCCSKAALCVCVCVCLSIRGCAKPSLAVPHPGTKDKHSPCMRISTRPSLLSSGFSTAQGGRRVQHKDPGSLHPCLADSRSSPSLSLSIPLPRVLWLCPAHPRRDWIHTVLAPAFSVCRETQPPRNSDTKESTGREVFNQSHCCSCSKSRSIKTFPNSLWKVTADDFCQLLLCFCLL